MPGRTCPPAPVASLTRLIPESTVRVIVSAVRDERLALNPGSHFQDSSVGRTTTQAYRDGIDRLEERQPVPGP